MNFSWHLQGFSSLRFAPAERFTLLRFAGGVPALTLATKTVLPSLPACRAWMISLGMLGLFRMLGGMLIMPGPPGPGPMPIPPAAITFCMALLACSPSGSWDTHTHSHSDPPPSTVTAMAQTATERGFPLSQAICSPGIPSRLPPFHCQTIYFILANTQHPLSSHSSSGISLLPNVFIHQ